MALITHDKNQGKKLKLTLDEILSGPDEFGLLAVKSRRSTSTQASEVSGFEEINAFIDDNSRLPQNTGDLSEKTLARRLRAFQEQTQFHEQLKPFDRNNLLVTLGQVSEDFDSVDAVDTDNGDEDAENVTSLDDIFASKTFANFDFNSDIFDIKHVPETSKDRKVPDEVAQQRKCEDFYKFEKIFYDTHKGIRDGDIKTARFQLASNVREGDMFIVEGVLCLIDEIGEYREDGIGRYDPRLRVIFENGTESNHLLQSLAKRLYTDPNGRRVIPDAESVEDALTNISHKDKLTGQIYFVTTLSDNPSLKAIPELIKIGYTERTVEERTKNAERDIAFLEAPVKILATMDCYNLNPQKFESLIHAFLHSQRLNIQLIGRDGKTYSPREWFMVSLDTAREVVRRIIDGSIVNYRIDNTTGRIRAKS